MRNNYYVKVSNPHVRQALASAIRELAEKTGTKHTRIKLWIEDHINDAKRYPYFSCWNVRDGFAGEFFFSIPEGHEDAQEITLEEMFTAIDKALHAQQPVVIKLNNEYFATVTKDAVQVGCQTFPASKIVEIYNAIQKLKS